MEVAMAIAVGVIVGFAGGGLGALVVSRLANEEALADRLPTPDPVLPPDPLAAVLAALTESNLQNLEMMRLVTSEIRQVVEATHPTPPPPSAYTPEPEVDFPVELLDPGYMDWTDSFIGSLGLNGEDGIAGVPAPPPGMEIL